MSKASRKIREQLGLDVAERTVPTGSMWPSIRAGDSIRFRRDPRAPRIGEVWVAEMGEVHVCHRVLWVSRERVLFKCDWVLRPDGWIARTQLFGPLSEVRRGVNWRPTNRRRDRALGMALTAAGSSTLAARIALSRVKRAALAVVRRAART
jgi:hypothetical protein